MADAGLYRLLTWLSPAYPTGAFSYSHGLEWAVEAGLVTGEGTLVDWVGAIIGHGAGRVDATFLTAAHSAASDDAFVAVAELAAAWSPAAELALETQAQGGAFLATTRAAWPHPDLDRRAGLWPGPWALPVAVGAAAAAHGLALAPVMTGYLHAFAANLVSAGQRLIPLGQTAAQRTIAALEPIIAAVEPVGPDRLGSATPMVDLAAMRHETQYTRLFRS